MSGFSFFNNQIMTIKKIFTGIVLLLALMWLSGELLLKSDERAAKAAQAVATTTSEVAGASTSSLAFTLLPEKQKQAPVPVSLIATSSEVTIPKVPLAAVTALDSKELISVTLGIDGKTFSHQLPKGSSVAALLVTAKESGEITYTGKEYSGLGMLIVSINGKENNQNKNNLYWIYSVNGQKATKGVSEYMLLPNDVVSWSYEQNTY